MTAIEVFADIWCPFTHVGLRNVMRRRAASGRDDVVIRARAWPLQLVNGKALDPETTSHHVEALRRQVAPDLFGGFDMGAFPVTTLPALTLAAAAYRRDVRTGEAVSLALRDAIFERGLDISRPRVLSWIATTYTVERTAVDEEAVFDDWREGRARGVQGSPHFFCGDRDAFCPSLARTRDLHGELELRLDDRALDAFLTVCLAGGPAETAVS